MHFCNCQYGFEYGAAKITRLFSDEKAGWVTIEVRTPKQDIQVYVTKTGKIRVHGASEWLPQKNIGCVASNIFSGGSHEHPSS